MQTQEAEQVPGTSENDVVGVPSACRESSVAAQRPLARVGRRAGLVALGWGAMGALLLGALGCGPPPIRQPNAMRTLDERRALEVIQRAITQEGAQPAPGRDVTLLSTGATIHIDVGVRGRDYGVVYVTEEDAAKLGPAIPPANRQDEKLRLVRAGEDGEVRLVLLYQTNYRYDDLVGESHEQTTITAERQLTRDVQDFITHARTRKFR
ncbi:hypothetical protein [Chondromyces crocatus]|uniref:Uncharacterized protein n=1 Tax=Chondromyces crocatus TaxID=52 RepID=A0A0K1EF31_CHOCO|nr:hypothetical protein [Chondromyces crocatus]AKT39173.1 uncharacterized protein CMC5_033200 [Chondromyces crocatus]